MHDILKQLETLKKILDDAMDTRHHVLRQNELYMAQAEREMLAYEDKIKHIISELEFEAMETERAMEKQSNVS